jgi:transcriptional regulator with XRE-family HTH domain
VNNKLHNEFDFNNLFISENLRRLRLLNNLTTTQVCKVINKTRQGYVNHENGSREISIHDLITLSGFYNVNVDELIGNPYSNRNEKRLAFRTYQHSNHEIEPTNQMIVSTINDDVIAVSKNDLEVDFYWRTQTNQHNHVMLFEYYDKTYTSKVFFNKDKGGFFFINDEPKFFTKANAENLLFKGIYMATLKKEFSIENFF